MKPLFFATPAEWRAWLEAHHAQAPEVQVGFYKRGSGRPSITWSESVDQALCFGWIDGVTKRLDDVSYTIRFTPRRARSIWSTVNLQKVEQLTAAGLMRPAGVAAFEARSAERSEIYSHENKDKAFFPKEYARRLEANAKAWAFFQAQPPWYQRTATFWVVSAKKEETRLRRMATLIEDSEQGRTVSALPRPSRKAK